MIFQLKAGLTALALILAPLAVQAHHKDSHGNGGGNGHGHSAQSEHGGGHAFGRTRSGNEDEGEEGAEGEDTATATRPCGWGLARRDTPCVPPGQARQGVTTEEWIGAPTDGYSAGQNIADRDYGLIVNTDQLGLDTEDLEPGQSYALVDDTIVVVDEYGTINRVVRRAAFPGHSGG